MNKSNNGTYAILLGTVLVVALVLAGMALVLNQSAGGGGGGGGGAPTDAQYLTLATDTGLSAERVLTGTSNQIILTDNGANSTLVLSLPQDIATTSNVNFNDATLDGLLIMESNDTSIETTQEAIRRAIAGELHIDTRGDLFVNIDSNNNGTGAVFAVRANGSGTRLFEVNENGAVTINTSFAITDGTDTITFTAPSITADRSVTYPDASGEVLYDTTIEWLAWLRNHGDYGGTQEFGSWHVAGCVNACIQQTGTGFIPGADDLQVYPLFLGNAGTFGTLRINVDTAVASTTARLGIYEADLSTAGDIYVGALVEDYGTVDTSTTGEKQLACTTCAAFTRGLYFLAAVVDSSSVAFERLDQVQGWAVYYGMDDAGVEVCTGLEVDNFSAAHTSLPDPFPTPSASIQCASPQGESWWIGVNITD